LSQVLVKEENGVKTFYVYGLGLLGEEKDGEEYRSYHFDFRGSTVALTDKIGKVVQRFQYGPYGELLKGEASVTPFLFNGKYGVMADGNGLYYMRARFYSPEMKRFVNMDVLLGNVSEGQTLNRYAFVTGQPVSYSDPFGLSAVVAEGLIDFGQWTIRIIPLPQAKAIAGICIVVGAAWIIWNSSNQSDKQLPLPLIDPNHQSTPQCNDLDSEDQCYEVHHFATNKNSKFTPQLQKLADKYGLDLDGSWNKGLLPHKGRHAEAYHRFVLQQMIRADKEAAGNTSKFLQLFEQYVKDVVRQNPDMLYK